MEPRENRKARRNQTPAKEFSVWQAVRRLLLDAGRKHARGYAIAMMFMIFVAVTTSLSAWLIKSVVNQVFVDRRIDELMLLAMAVVVISILRGASLYGSDVTLTRVGNSIVGDMQKRIYDHMLALGMDFYDRKHSSELIATIGQRASAASSVLTTVMTSFGRDLLSVIGLVTVMIIQSPWMSILALVIAPLAILGVRELVRRIRAVSNLEYQTNAQIISVIQETALGIRIIKAFNLEDTMRGQGRRVDRPGADPVEQDRGNHRPDLAAHGGAWRRRDRGRHGVGGLCRDPQQ